MGRAASRLTAQRSQTAVISTLCVLWRIEAIWPSSLPRAPENGGTVLQRSSTCFQPVPDRSVPAAKKMKKNRVTVYDHVLVLRSVAGRTTQDFTPRDANRHFKYLAGALDITSANQLKMPIKWPESARHVFSHRAICSPTILGCVVLFS